MVSDELERPKVVELASKPGMYTVKGPMRRWRMQATDRPGLQGTGYGRKETGWMTNHPELAIFKGECINCKGTEQHRHIHLVGGIARQAAAYPPKPVRAVLKVLREELADRGQLNSREAASSGPVPEELSILEDDYWFLDDVTGGILLTEEVKKARSLEIDCLYKQGVCRVVKRSEVTAEGIKPVYRSEMGRHQ